MLPVASVSGNLWITCSIIFRDIKTRMSKELQRLNCMLSKSHFVSTLKVVGPMQPKRFFTALGFLDFLQSEHHSLI